MASFEDYDEFGNYIGADLGSDEEEEEILQQDFRQVPQQPATLEGYDDEPMPSAEGALMEIDEPVHNAVVLHEDKQYYPSAEDVYGPDVETLVQEEDAQPLTEPIVAPIKVRKWTVEEKDMPQTRFDKGFLLNMMSFPEMIRNIAVVGHLHHGKTALMDMLVFETHKLAWDADKPTRYTDTHILSREREISIKSSPMSLILSTTSGKSHLVHLIDTPGHVNFVDEVASAIRLVDGILLVVDVVEGMMVNTEAIIRHALQEGVKITLVVNKIDRLILELRIKPADAYYKIKHTIEEINTFISGIDPSPELRLSPENGNVVFASTDMSWCFTLRSFAQMYADTFGSLDVASFADRLWGDIYFNAETRKFTRKAADPEQSRTFVHFILDPLYKLYSHVLSEDTEDLKNTLASLKISLKPVMYKMDVRPLLKAILDQFFGPATGLIDMIAEHIPSPMEGAASKVERTYTGPQTSEIAVAMKACDTEAPAMVQITKLYHTTDAQSFRAFGRVMSGTLRKGTPIKVLGEGYSPEDEEDMARATVEDIWISEARYFIPADEVPAGNLVLIAGVDASISKTATLADPSIDDDLYIFRPIKHMTESVLKIAIEPIAPSELPKMLSGLRSINKSYPLAATKVEESGEHVLIGTGELYLDCVMHDLRRLFAEIEIKVSDPVTKFCETVLETSALKCYADTPNKKNKLTMIAEPLERGIAEDIERGRVTMRMTPKERGTFFQDKYQWDLLASRSIWAFGPDDSGPNILLDDTLPSQVDKKLLGTVKEHIKQGFQWGAREGPLCDEPMRNVKFRILDASLAQEPIFRGGGQIVPTARRVCYSSFLMATPRLMEPIYYVEVQAPADCISAVYTVLARRRGHVTQDIPKAGSPLYTVKALIPVIDANGFEADLRTATQGQAFCLQVFDHWSIVPGDPTDTSIKLRPLEPASGQALARDLVLKTRRRKGLGDQIAVSKYLDDEFVVTLSVILVAVAASASASEDSKPVFKATEIKAPFIEQFTDDYVERWTPSEATKKTPVGGEIFSYVGKWEVEEPETILIEGEKGLVAKSKAAHHAISAPFAAPVDFKDKPLVVQYEVKYQKGGNCGGGYIKLLEDGFQTSGKEFSDNTPWVVMFGPDNTCPGTKLHFIFRHQNPISGEFEEKHLSVPPKPTFGKDTNLYTLIVNPDNTYDVLFNGESQRSGNLLEDFTPAVNPAKEIDDPEDKKPEDWVNEKRISDPDAVKPADWDETAPYEIPDEDAVKPEGWLDDAPPNIPDPDAEKPEEWDDEEDGDWIAPTVRNPACDEAPGCGEWKRPNKANPEYKGKWYAPMIDNPVYIGEWAPRKIPNPNFFEDLEPVKHLNNIGGVGIELWTMTEDILFSNIYVGHSVDDAKALAAETYDVKKTLEAALSAQKDVDDESDYYIPPFLEDPISHIRGKIAQFLDAAREDPLSAIQTHPETGLGLAGVVATLFGMLAVLFGLVGSQQKKPIAKAKKTDTSTPDDKQKADSTPVAPAGGEKKNESTTKKRK
ncbi:Calreticulin family-domain-containing protein [Suillus clintonianus]|uniref:Calreticulin family-domain-containing protein n=1 Tax=Suillus clintonianus TaxID=1904413 RepID=UPI001B873189|nr:Calreticulin family-domain-containing protein [Suillus clintonianus]KAG2155719.1 Calreticulin family-domain-containing protein [Suillus clintonianus]